MRSHGLASQLRISDLIREAMSAILERPARTALSAMGTVIGVGTFVATTGLADTARAQVSAQFDVLKATEVRVQDRAPDGSNPFPNDVDGRLERLNGVVAGGLLYRLGDEDRLTPRTTPALLSGFDQPVPVMAATPGALQAAGVVLRTGVLYNRFHEQRGERVALLGAVAAHRLGIARVDNQPAVFVGDAAYTITGIIDSVVRDPELLLSIVIPTTTERTEIHGTAQRFEVLIETEHGAARLAGREAPRALRPHDPERLVAIVPPDPETLRNHVASDVTTLYYAVAGVSLLVGTLAIASFTLLSTIHRRGEIGLRRALGAKRSHISAQITLEAALTGAFAAVIGAAIAVIGVAIAARIKDWTLTLDVQLTMLAPAMGLVTGAIAGVAPARLAAKSPPAATLRSL